MEKNRVDVITMGCSKNLVDSEHLMRQLQECGYDVVHDSDEPCGEIAVINTCGFIGDAKQESINMILEFCQRKEQGDLNKLYVMGCLSERYLKDLEVENIGNGSITLVGKADNARIFLSGAGKINMENYAIRNCTCENSGAGDIYIYASKQLDCMLFGKGNIYYMGDPEIKKDIPGVGKLIKR